MKKAVIIGAGPAGLTAAYMLLKKTDIRPCILEETSAIGGISRTAEYKGNRMDLGGHRFFSKNGKVVDIWKELMPIQGHPAWDDNVLGVEKPLCENGPDPEKEDRVMLIRNRVSRIYYLKKFFDYPISINLETVRNLGLKRSVKSGVGYVSSSLRKRNENSLEDFYINRFGKQLYSMFFERYTEKLWGVHPSHIAPDWGAQRVKELSLSKVLAEFLARKFKKDHKTKCTSLIEQFMYPKKGPGQLWEQMASEIVKMGGEIRLNSKVVGVDTKENRVISVRTDKETIKGDLFFSSMPIKDLAYALDECPDKVRDVAVNLPYRDFITVGLLLRKLKIANTTRIRTINNIVPDCWIYIQEPEVKLGRLQVFNNWSPYMVSNPDNVFIGLEYFCCENDELWNMSDKEFADFAARELEEIGIIDMGDVLDSITIKVKKAYPAYFGTYSEFNMVREYLDSFENLFCIGRNGQHRYNNMDHSMLTAMVAVENIKNGVRDKSNIWNVNTEAEYHEEK